MIKTGSPREFTLARALNMRHKGGTIMEMATTLQEVRIELYEFQGSGQTLRLTESAHTSVGMHGNTTGNIWGLYF